MEPIRDFFRLEDEEPHLVPTILTLCVIMGLLASFFAESNPYVFFEICRYVSLLSLWAIILIGLVFLSLRRWVDSRRTKLGPGEIARQDGYAFGLWFTAHNLVWVFLISVLICLVRPIGVQGWVLVLLAGGVAGLLLSVCGIFALKRRWVLGISWLSPALVRDEQLLGNRRVFISPAKKIPIRITHGCLPRGACFPCSGQLSRCFEIEPRSASHKVMGR